jgi:hypothetical protein
VGGVRVPRVGKRGEAVGGKGAREECGGGKWEGDERPGRVIWKVGCKRGSMPVPNAGVLEVP